MLEAAPPVILHDEGSVSELHGSPKSAEKARYRAALAGAFLDALVESGQKRAGGGAEGTESFDYEGAEVCDVRDFALTCASSFRRRRRLQYARRWR